MAEMLGFCPVISRSALTAPRIVPVWRSPLPEHYTEIPFGIACREGQIFLLAKREMRYTENV
jgi:hypothetical protein